MVRGAVTTLALLLALAPVARAQEKVPTDWKWDAIKWARAQFEDRTYKVGDKHFSEGHEKDSQDQKMSMPDGTGQNEARATEVAFRYVEEMLEIAEGGKAKKSKVVVEKWTHTKSGAEADKCLEGKTLIVTHDGDASKHEVEGGAAVSDDAAAWISKNLYHNKKSQDEKMDVLLPSEPLAPGGEWKVDPAKLAEAMFGPGVGVDVEKSKGSGKLTDVRMEKNHPMGKVSIQIHLQLKTIPGTENTPWKEGGAFVITVDYDGSLINNRRQRTEKMSMDFGGKGEIEGPAGKVGLEMKITGLKEGKSGKVK